MTKNKKHCTYCDSTEHTIFYCPKKPKTVLKPYGKYAKRMKQVRDEWFELNPPDHSGYYYCVYCGKGITREPKLLAMGVPFVTLDHKLSRGRHPDLRFDLKNLVPCCEDCNLEKGSKDSEKGLFE
jgi:5-methylcytosine-specific restriction endonuclease McrA